MSNPQFVPTSLRMKASASLEEQVAKELSIPDPSREKAKAALRKPNENSNTDDGEGED